MPAVKITYPKRIEKYLIDRTALREAVINAIVHNDYVRGGAPLFEIYDDRIKIVSYGGLVNGLTEEEFFSGCSMPRNRELMQVFRDMELVENFGSGMHRILQIYSPDIFKISENFVITEFKYAEDVLERIHLSVDSDRNEPVNEPVKLSKATKEVLDCLQKNPNMTIQTLVAETGVARETVKRALKTLREKGFIRRIGSDKTGHYEIIQK